MHVTLLLVRTLMNEHEKGADLRISFLLLVLWHDEH